MEKTDVYGRIESFDQSVRSIERRLRAVERRLSTSKDDYIRTVQESSENIQWTDPDIEELQAEFNDLEAEFKELHDVIEKLTSALAAIKSDELTQLNSSMDALRQGLQAASSRIEELGGQQSSLKKDTSTSVESINNAHSSQIETLREELEDTRQRLQRQENMNKISIGNIKVPVELSGIVASIALIATGYLVWADRWDIIRSTYYPTGLAILFASAVIAKFIITNRHSDTS
jgi:chromosome segregation ATPase